MNKTDQKQFDELIIRVTDIYSGCIGVKYEDDNYLIGLEEASRLIPAILGVFFPISPPIFTDEVGHWVTFFETPERCSEWLWSLRHELHEYRPCFGSRR